MRIFVIVFGLLFSLSACDRTGVTAKGGSESKTEWGVTIGF
jgi:hypothetical protein